MNKLIILFSSIFLMVASAGASEMENRGPSMSIGGEAEIGFQYMDDKNDETKDLHLVKKYKVTFGSQGVTDGGLVFGADISIEDTAQREPYMMGYKLYTFETGQTGVGKASVYVGSSDGLWKLRFGNNKPGIDVVGGFGVADDHFYMFDVENIKLISAEDNNVPRVLNTIYAASEYNEYVKDRASISLEGSFSGLEYRLTMANPQAMGDAKDNWSVGAKYTFGDYNVGVGMDSNKGYAVSAGTEISGVDASVYYSKSEKSKGILNNGTEISSDDGSHFDDDTVGVSDYTGLGVKASVPVGENATISAGYSVLKEVQDASIRKGTTGVNHNAYDATAKTKLIEVDFSYDLGGGAKAIFGVDKGDIESIGNAVDTSAPGTSNVGVDKNKAMVTSKSVTSFEAKLAFTF